MILWADIETTGLTPEHSQILEIALVVTDDNLEILAQKDWVVSPGTLNYSKWSWQVRTMHVKSGLINDVLSKGQLMNSSYSRQSVSTQIHDFVWNEVYGRNKEKHVGEFDYNLTGVEKTPLAGSTVHFDKAFLLKEIPYLDQQISHRVIDVSSIKELVKRWYPDLEPWEKKDVHRALPDVLDSIEELKYYREKIFKEGAK